MKKLASIFIIISFSVQMYGQKNLELITLESGSTVVDSDGVISSDYYTGNFAVRSGTETYDVVYNSNNLVGLVNRNNLFLDKNRNQYDKRTGELLDVRDLPLLLVDSDVLYSVCKEVFPYCEFTKTYTDSYLGLTMAFDPKTLNVLEMKIYIKYLETDKRMLSIPPSKIKLLEVLVKERITGRFSLPEDMYPDFVRNVSYLKANYRIYFSSFAL